MTINLDIYEVNTLIYLVEKRIIYFQSKIISGKDNELEEEAIKKLEGIKKELTSKRKLYDDELPF